MINFQIYLGDISRTQIPVLKGKHAYYKISPEGGMGVSITKPNNRADPPTLSHLI
jgi:hypothetical protein